MKTKTINITIDEGRVTIFTNYRSWIRRLKQLATDRPAHVACLSEGPAGTQFTAPVDWIRLNPSRLYSKESRQKLRQSCKENCLPALEKKRQQSQNRTPPYNEDGNKCTVTCSIFQYQHGSICDVPGYCLQVSIGHHKFTVRDKEWYSCRYSFSMGKINPNGLLEYAHRALESIFARFNEDCPPDYFGECMKASDILVFSCGEKRCAYLCLGDGWEDISAEFFATSENTPVDNI